MNTTEIIVSKRKIDNIPILEYCDKNTSPKALVILAHEFIANKEALIPYLHALASNGYVAVGIDNRLHGERADISFKPHF